MAYFSDSEINEAKERVRRMHQKASSYIDNSDENNAKTSHQSKSPQVNKPQNAENAPKKAEKKVEEKANENEESKGDESFIILMLILLLSHDGADNSLILALLYLLF